MARRPKIHAGSHEAWTVFALSLVAILVPTACVLWFMTHAMRNEQLAARQTLTDTYRRQLLALQNELDGFWSRRLANLQRAEVRGDPRSTFAARVRGGDCHAVIICDQGGRPLYPDSSIDQPARVEDPIADGFSESDMFRLELENPAEACKRYASLAEVSSNTNTGARALIGQAHCLVRLGRTAEAMEVLLRLNTSPYNRATDRTGRMIMPNAELLAMQTLRDPDSSSFQKTAAQLARHLNDYTLPIPASQRRFLMEQHVALVPNGPAFPTLEAERLAARYLDALNDPASMPAEAITPLLLARQAMGRLEPLRLSSTAAPGVWQISLASGAVALFDQGRMMRELQSLNTYPPMAACGCVELVSPTSPTSSREPVLDMAAGAYLPQWRLALFIDRDDPFKQAAARMTAIYLWTGVLVIIVIALFAILAARYVTRQMRLTRLKNDLIATVSHELRTPLSSIRLLVDTLLDNGCRDSRQTLDYLALISNENNRLCRLVDNFLTFSRMERNKRVFTFLRTAPREIAQAAVAAVHERFAAGNCRLHADIDAAVPMVVADRDAMVTVLLNLLDNAYKYSDPPREIALRVYAQDGHVCFEVSDHGIGISRRTARRIFERFYQVDQRLSRKAEGCGLGLSIVKFIVDAHNGSIDVDSRQGKGSTFTVRLNAEEDAGRDPERVVGHGE